MLPQVDANRIFLEYLDHHIGFGSTVFNTSEFKERRLKFDLLAFPDKDFFVAAPALAKSNASLILTATQHEFSLGQRIHPVLPKDVARSFENYVKLRLSMLSERMPEDEYKHSAEVIGYTSNNWRYLFDPLREREKTLLIHEREHSADLFYRKYILAKVADSNFVDFAENKFGHFGDALRYIHDAADDLGNLFQREAIIGDLGKEFKLSAKKSAFIENIFNNGFDACNSFSSNSYPSSMYPGVNGCTLERIAVALPVDFRLSLFDAINKAPLNTIIHFSKDRDWIDFLFYIRQLYKEASNLLHASPDAIVTARMFTERLGYFVSQPIVTFAKMLLSIVTGAIIGEVMIENSILGGIAGFAFSAVLEALLKVEMLPNMFSAYRSAAVRLKRFLAHQRRDRDELLNFMKTRGLLGIPT